MTGNTARQRRRDRARDKEGKGERGLHRVGKKKKAKDSGSESESELVLGKYKSLDEVPTEIALTQEEHDKIVKMELKRNPFKYMVRQVGPLISNCMSFFTSNSSNILGVHRRVGSSLSHGPPSLRCLQPCYSHLAQIKV